MNKLAKFSLTLIACAFIAACGSSGGGSDNHQPSNNNGANSSQSNSANNNAKPNNTNNTTNTTKPTTPTNPTTPSQNSNKTGAVLKAIGLDPNVTYQNIDLTNSNFNTLEVDGKKFQLVYPGIYAGTFQTINNVTVCCGTLKYSRFGVKASMNENDPEYVFYNGNPTSNMPTSGTATYKGRMIIGADHGKLGASDEDYVKGTSTFTADFGNKTLNGTLTTDGNLIQPVNVSAKISGNDFTGTASSADLKGQANVDGKFYGPNAAELGGKFESNSTKSGESWGGAFGAAK